MARLGSETAAGSSADAMPSTGPNGPGSMEAPVDMGSTWRLHGDLDAYSRPSGPGLATQVRRGRHLRVLATHHAGTGLPTSRLRVRLLEDGYPCWIEPSDLLGRAVVGAVPRTPRLQRPEIEARLEAVLAAAEQARQ